MKKNLVKSENYALQNIGQLIHSYLKLLYEALLSSFLLRQQDRIISSVVPDCGVGFVFVYFLDTNASTSLPLQA